MIIQWVLRGETQNDQGARIWGLAEENRTGYARTKG
jgi:hypothetical protein